MPLRLEKAQLDDRREIWRAVERMTPRQRLAWLRWCCELVSDSQLMGVRVTGGDGSVGQIFADLSLLELQYDLNVEVAANELVRRVRKL